jgi:hypothetical protein
MAARATSVELHHLNSHVITDAFKILGFTYSEEEDPHAQLIWWDRHPPIDEFSTYRQNQRVNKIPNMERVCYKSAFFQALNQMQTLFPNYYHFFPRTLMLPHQFNEFQKEHVRLSRKFEWLTWILKPETGCCGAGIRLIQRPFDVISDSSSAVIQQYIDPYLIDGFKFDFRFYILITDLQPLTFYIYKDGIARFCTKKYHRPTRHNLSDRFSHITNTAINIENSTAENDNFTRPASDVIGEVQTEDLWERVRTLSIFTILAIYPQLIANVTQYPSRRPNAIDPLHRYFHILGIDVLVNARGDPLVLELNDNPSMKVTFPFEHALKKALVVDALKRVIPAGTDGVEPIHNNWERLLPLDDTHGLYRIVQAIQQRSLNVFGPKGPIPSAMTPAKAIVYPKPVPSRAKLLFRAYRYHFQ